MKRQTGLSLLCCLLGSLLAREAGGQSLPAATIDKIDGFFKQWSNDSTPGFAIGIVRHDSLLYSKGYGMANLEYGIPNTAETIFHMASVSKQFTAFSIVLLARQGRLHLDDDIRQYLPWFPDLKVKITIRHLLNHTSGIRDQWQLLAIAGTRLDDVITQDQIIKILSRQTALNAPPGTEYNYSNSGFTLLAEIVKSVSGQTLRQFTDSAIFKPLGMTHTHFHDDYTEIERNRAYSYQSWGKNHFANAVLSYSNVGATSLFTNVDDMGKWVMNFYNHKVGDQQDIAQLTKKGILNSGKVMDYALGIQVTTYHGSTLYAHNGADAGFRTYVGVLPDLKTGFIVFSNLGDADPGSKANQLMGLFVKDTTHRQVQALSVTKDIHDAELRDTLSVKGLTGDYISDDGIHFVFGIKEKKLLFMAGGGRNVLIRTQQDTFAVFFQPAVKFVWSVQGRDTVIDEYWPGDNHRRMVKYDTSAKTDAALRTYTGIYYCPELDCSYGIELKDHHLVLTNSKYEDTRLSLYGDNQLVNDFWWMNNLMIVRDNGHQITGFEVNAGRIKHVWFKKVKTAT